MNANKIIQKVTQKIALVKIKIFFPFFKGKFEEFKIFVNLKDGTIFKV